MDRQRVGGVASFVTIINFVHITHYFVILDFL